MVVTDPPELPGRVEGASPTCATSIPNPRWCEPKIQEGRVAKRKESKVPRSRSVAQKVRELSTWNIWNKGE